MKNSRWPCRSGFTLIELMMVVFVIMAVTVLAIRMFNPGTQERRIREGARMVDTYIQGARDRAGQSGQLYGVMFERDAINDTCLTVSYAAPPQPYCGDTFYSRAKVDNWTVTAVYSLGSGGSETPDASWSTLVRVGDLIQFNYQGPYYRIASVTGTGCTFAMTWTDPTGNAVSPSFPDGAPFRVQRRPVKTADPPLTLPDSVVVDLANSGTEVLNFTAADADDQTAVMVMFNAGGSVDHIWYDSGSGSPFQRVTSAIHFLIGTTGAVAAGNDLFDLRNFWVTVLPRSGRVKTDENAYVADQSDPDSAREGARRFARDVQGLTD